MLAKTRPQDALNRARDISDPWFRAQALSWVARFTNTAPVSIAAEAAKAAADCDDEYKRAAVRAWEISALAERGYTCEARGVLKDALERAKTVVPPSSRSEALLLLIQAAFQVGADDAERAYQVLTTSCNADDHWRCKRAIREGERLLRGETPPRPFFW